MLKKEQELYERIYGSIGGDNITDEYQLLLEVMLMFSEEERKQLDYDVIKRDFLYHIAMNELDLNFAYSFDRKMGLNIKEEINEKVITNGNTKAITSYIALNPLEDEEIISISVKAIKKALPDSKEDIEILDSLKKYLDEKNLYLDVVTAIKQTGDPETLVCSALLFETGLIDEVFGGKKNMYFYLCANTFTDNEDIEYFKARLLNMDNNQLNRQLQNSAKRIDAKIKEKKLNTNTF